MQQMPVLLNNLAWVLLSAEPPQLDKALSMADAAVKALPQHPEIRETRGVILARLGRSDRSTGRSRDRVGRLSRSCLPPRLAGRRLPAPGRSRHGRPPPRLGREEAGEGGEE